MLVPDAPMHNWTLSRQSNLIRFYVWFYVKAPFGLNWDEAGEGTTDLSLSRLTFCRLFWAVICAPLIVALLIVLSPLIALIATIVWIVHQVKDRKADVSRQEAKVVRTAERVARGPNLFQRILTKVGNFFDAIAAFFQRHPSFGNAFSVLGTVLVWMFFIVVPLAILAFVAFEIYNHWNGTITGLIWTGVILGMIAAIAVFSLAVAGLMLKTSVGVWIADGAAFLGLKVWTFLCWVGRGFRGVYRFFAAGHHAVKYRTCPRVTVSS